jgi:hypothetical protein
MTPVANLPPVSTMPAANFATSFTSVVDTGGKFATGVNDTGSKFAAGVNNTGGKLPPVSTTPAANLPPVSLTPGQIMGLISGCKYLKVNLKAKMYICVNSPIQRCPKKIIKIFLIEDFSHLPPVSTTLVVNLELGISPRIFKKFRNGSNGILWGWGETD